MTFFEHYNNIKGVKEKRAFRKEIIKICLIEPSTFYTWLHRKIVPLLAQNVIASFMQKDQKELFPNSVEQQYTNKRQYNTIIL